MSKIKKYTKEECELIYSNSIKKKNKLTYEELAEKLGRTVEGIRKKELELKRKALSEKRCSGWSDSDIKKLQAVLEKDDFNINDLKKAVKGKDIIIIKEKALELLTTNGKNNQYNRPWTDEETDYLKRWWGIEDVTTIGIHLRRSKEGLRVRAKKLGICSKKVYYTARECSQMLGISDNTFLTYINKKYVNSRKAKTEQLIHQIKHDELIDFMKNHQDKWDSRKMKDSPFIIDKPDWFIEKVKIDKLNLENYLDTQKKWTDEDYKYLLEAKEKGVTFEEIAKKLNRKVSAVKSKYEKRNAVEKQRKEREERLKQEAIKKLDYDTLDRLIKEFENEKSYILKKVYKINARKITEDDIELCSNLRMIGYDCKEISEMVEIGHRFLQKKLFELKDEEYVVDIDKDKMSVDNELKLFEDAKKDSLYELCLTYKKNYNTLITTYEKVLREKYSENLITCTLDDDIKYLLLKLQGMKNRQIGQKLGKSEKSIRSRMNNIRVRKFIPNDKREWIKDELKILKIYKEDNNKVSLDDLSKTFKRTEKCINEKINEL